ncbi:MAG: glycosyltransferase family 4 protein [Alphaproteobacteria bacterium]|nr:MAG: glycosyltransferase family 4 protein [Alphaproteobacteria bacterium]
MGGRGNRSGGRGGVLLKPARGRETRLTGPLSILTFTSLYPNAAQPAHGLFVETRLRHLVATRPVRARVVAPVPRIPFWPAALTPAAYRRASLALGEEMRAGITVHHPRYPMIPGFARRQARWMAAATLPLMRRLVAEEAVDLIDAHYLYPDAVAAVRIAHSLGLPVVLSARGSDVNRILEIPGYRRQILSALGAADHVIAVSEALRRRLLAEGLAPDRVTTICNGVDAERFRPIARDEARCRLGLAEDGPLLLSVARLDRAKGQACLIEALGSLPRARLLLVGAGPDRRRLVRLARRLGVGERVAFVGEVAHDRLPLFYSAADIFLHAAIREGCPNVILEAMACGLPVVARAVGGVPEILAEPVAGRLLAADADPRTFAEAVRSLIASPASPAAVRSRAMRFSWSEVSERLEEVFRQVRAKARAPAR